MNASKGSTSSCSSALPSAFASSSSSLSSSKFHFFDGNCRFARTIYIYEYLEDKWEANIQIKK